MDNSNTAYIQKEKFIRNVSSKLQSSFYKIAMKILEPNSSDGNQQIDLFFSTYLTLTLIFCRFDLHNRVRAINRIENKGPFNLFFMKQLKNLIN